MDTFVPGNVLYILKNEFLTNAGAENNLFNYDYNFFEMEKCNYLECD